MLIDKRLHRLLQHGNGKIGNGDELFVRRLRFQRADLQNLPRDALGIITDALQFEIDFDRRVGKAQMSAGWLLADEELEAKPIDLLLQLIDVLVAQDDGIGQLAVAPGERAQRIAQSRLRALGHFHHFRLNDFSVAQETFFVVRGHCLILNW